MADLRTSYMGVELKNPVIAGASRLTGDMDMLRRIEDAGAAAVVTASLFEEQIRIQQDIMEDTYLDLGGHYVTELNLPSPATFMGPEEHLEWVRKTKEALDIPVFASLNAVTPQIWVEWAARLAETGVDGLELNFYSNPAKPDRNSGEIEKEQLETLEKIQETLSIPVSVKAGPYYTNIVNFISGLSEAGADGMVLFNRFLQPDIDIHSRKENYGFELSSRMENRLPLRYTALTHGRIKADLCASTGIYTAEDVLKFVMAGASCVQVVSCLYKNGIPYLEKLISDMEKWMEENSTPDIKSIKGTMDKRNSTEPYAYERAQYINVLLKSSESVSGYDLF